MSLNLSSKPFVNRRPVRRISALAWIAGLALAALNGYLYWDYLSGQGATASGLQEVVSRLEEESELLARAGEQLAGLETDELNEKIEFVNLRIQQRTFSWSRLFDVLAATMPNDVRLSSLAPRFGRAARAGARRAKSAPDEGVRLEIRGQAKTSQALLEFLDSLFAHPAFENPDLHNEQARNEPKVIDFSISTVYLTDAVDPAPSPASTGDRENEEQAAAEAPEEAE